MKKKTLENKINKDKFSLVKILQGQMPNLSFMYSEHHIIKSNLTEAEVEELRKTYVANDKGEFETKMYHWTGPLKLVAKYRYWIEKEPIDHQSLSRRATPSLM